MKILKIVSQHRRDLQVVLVCQHCDAQEARSGYDDIYFHAAVVPNLQCKSCGKLAPADFEPIMPKYADGVTV